MKQSKVSILIPVYNVEKYISRCLDSILNQTYNNIEIILVDDCSEDNSLGICYDYAKKDERIKIIKKPSHTVLSDVRNVGIDNASGEYIMFADSDDYVENNFVEEMVKTIEEKNVDIVRCKAKVYNKNGKYEYENLFGLENQIFIGKNKIKSLIPYFTLLNNNIACYTWALIIKKDKINIRFDSNIYCRQDTVFLIELLLDSIDSMFFLDKALYNYCYNNSSITKSVETYYRYINSLLVSDKKIKNILSNNNLLNDKIEKGINNEFIELIMYKQKNFSQTSIFKIKRIIKETYNRQEVRNILKKIDFESLNFKRKLKFLFIKLHLYFFIALYIKNSNR